MRLFLASGVGACLMAQAAVAQTTCPVLSDLEGGVALTFADGLVERYRTGPDETVIVDVVEDDVALHRLTLYQGAYLGRYVALEDGEELEISSSVYVYPEGEDGPQRPVVGAEWAGDVTLIEVGEPLLERQQHSVGLPLEVTLGACAYTAVPVTIRYGFEDEYVEVVHYLPDLGFGYLHAFANQGRDQVVQAVTDIEVVE